MALPAFNTEGDLPPGVHRATLPEVLERFGEGSVQRCAVAERLNITVCGYLRQGSMNVYTHAERIEIGN